MDTTNTTEETYNATAAAAFEAGMQIREENEPKYLGSTTIEVPRDPVITWHKLGRATENNVIARTERAVLLTVPKTDWQFWIPAKLVREKSTHLVVSVPSAMTIKLQKMGKGQWNSRSVIDEKVMTGDQFAAYWEAQK